MLPIRAVVELIDLIPNSLSFRYVAMIDLEADEPLPEGYTGRVRRYDDGVLLSIGWYQRGELHDPDRSHPAYRLLRASGRVKYELWYQSGCLQDPAVDSPAVRGFYADGRVHYEERWTNGKRQDGGDGTAALRKWRADGTLRHELRYRQGIRAA